MATSSAFPPAPPPASSRLLIFDTTLRDGEQSPGVSLNSAAKLRIGRALAELGVDIAEIGFPACAVDLQAVRDLVKELGNYTPATRPTLGQQSSPHPMTLAVLARCVKSDIDLAWDVVRSASKPRIHVFYATSDIHLQYKLKKTQAEALDTIREMVTYARSLCSDVEWSAEDASRTSADFLAQAAVTAINAGATTINLPDTVGASLPYHFLSFVADVRARVFAAVPPSLFHSVTFSTHCHNDLGLATANTISAVAAGCRQVEVTINGIGERAGNTAMEEVVMAAHLHPDAFSTTTPLTHSIQTRLIVPTSTLVAELTGMLVQRNKAIVGKHCLAEGTLVSLANGTSLPIEEVQATTDVLSYHAALAAGETEGLTVRQVDARLVQGVQKCVELLFSDGRTLVCTPDHRIRTAGGQWVAAGDLQIGTAEVAVGVEYPNSHAARGLHADVGGALGLALQPSAALSPASTEEDTASAVPPLKRLRADSEPIPSVQGAGGRAVIDLVDDDVEAADDEENVAGDDEYKSVDKVTYGVHHDARVLPLFRVRLIGRRDVGEKRVYDLSVPSAQGDDSASFVANGVVVHNCCLHESGVHVDGILKNRSTYEIFPAELVGWGLTNNGIVLGKHSGRAAYKGKLNELGVQFKDDAQLQASFARFQAMVHATTGEVAFTSEQLLQSVHTEAPLDVIESKEAPTTTPTQTLAAAGAQSAASTSGDLIIELMGDGINDEVTAEGRRVLEAVAAVTGRTFTFERHPIGGRAIDLTGNPLPPATLEACKRSKAVLLGAVGDPRFNDPNLKVRPEQGLLAIRSALELYQNLRPVVVFPSLIDASPFRRDVVEGTDVMIVRELTGGIYNNVHQEGTKEASDVMFYTVEEIERIVRAAAVLARGRKKKLVSLDKANVLACSRLWRNTVTRLMKAEFPDISYEHMLIDSAAMHLIKNPRYFDVIVTENLFGDILSDEAAALASSLGMMGSASLSSPGKPGLYEPVHGSAPDIAGKGIANPIGTILSVAMMLRYSLDMPEAAAAVEKAIADVVESGVVTPDIAKRGVAAASTTQVGQAIAERATQLLRAATSPTQVSSTSGRRPMTLPEKILCHQALGLVIPEVRPGEWIVVKVARTLASEMTWLGMSETWATMGQPPLWRKDRFFLAIDHTVDPSNYSNEFQSKLISAAEGFAKSIDLVDYFAPNESILHTEFYRQRALPGTVICGADSHSCSAGCLGAFAAGLGAADVVMPTVTGQTFFQVPETLLINFHNDLPFGMTGKDVMLYLMSKVKRNTKAFERVVEFNGSIRSMSIDCRFALANMTTEFGGIAGIFPADEVTASFLAGRTRDRSTNKDDQQASRHNKVALDSLPDDEGEPLYFQADPTAEYADRFDIDLADVTPLIAKYPSPDNVYPIDHPEIDAVVPEVGRSIRKLDGCFIGACTTTEEELILAALVLEVALKEGVKPVAEGTRKVTPGSTIITRKLERLGLISVYRQAGFTIGSAGCSYCIAVSSDVAPKGSVWLSSQNRNFRNRMGPGSIGNLASAATVAVSSLFMTITDPRPFLAKVDRAKFVLCLEREPIPASVPRHEPNPPLSLEETEDQAASAAAAALVPSTDRPSSLPSRIAGKVQRFEDNIDTDAIIPAQRMLDRPLSRLAKSSFAHVRPDFVERVNAGYDIVVGGIGFGSGSSREEAVSCLRACGVKAVIAKGFAFIYSRNLLTLDLLGLIITDEAFYALAQEGAEVEIDVDGQQVLVGGQVFPFELSPIQLQIYRQGGVIQMYKESGPQLFKQLADVAKKGAVGGCGSGAGKGGCAPVKDPAHADLDGPKAIPPPAKKPLEW